MSLPEGRRADNSLPVLSCADFMRGPDCPEYLLDGLLERGRSLALVAPNKTLKTLLCDDLMLSLAAGVPALGTFRAGRPARVLMAPGETPAEDKRRSLKAIAAARGVALPVENLMFSDGWFPRIPEDVPALATTVRDHRIEVVCIDPAYLALGSVGTNAGNLFVVGGALGALSAALGRERCAVVIIHHTNEQLQTGQRPKLRHMSFAGFSQWARSWVMLNRRSEYVEGSGKHALLMVAGGSSGRSGAWDLDVDEGTPAAPRWCVSVTLAGRSAGAPAAGVPASDSEDAAKVTAYLAKYPAGETRSKIRGKAGLDTNRTARALDALIAAGRVEPCTVMKAGKRQGYDGFRLVTPQRSEGRDKVGESDLSDPSVPGVGVKGSEGRRVGYVNTDPSDPDLLTRPEPPGKEATPPGPERSSDLPERLFAVDEPRGLPD